jgi:hypothetical protein
VLGTPLAFVLSQDQTLQFNHLPTFLRIWAIRIEEKTQRHRFAIQFSKNKELIEDSYYKPSLTGCQGKNGVEKHFFGCIIFPFLKDDKRFIVICQLKI